MSKYLSVGSIYIETGENYIDGSSWEYFGIEKDHTGDYCYVFQCTELDYDGFVFFQYFSINTPDKDFERWFTLSSEESDSI